MLFRSYAPEDISAGYEVRGVVFRDDDGDGTQDAGEPPIVGMLVTADGVDCPGPPYAADHSDERGRYKLEGQEVACPLPWLVVRAAIAGTVDTTPGSVRLTAPPQSGREFVVNFGVRYTP